MILQLFYHPPGLGNIFTNLKSMFYIIEIYELV